MGQKPWGLIECFPGMVVARDGAGTCTAGPLPSSLSASLRTCHVLCPCTSPSLLNLPLPPELPGSPVQRPCGHPLQLHTLSLMSVPLKIQERQPQLGPRRPAGARRAASPSALRTLVWDSWRPAGSWGPSSWETCLSTAAASCLR